MESKCIKIDTNQVGRGRRGGFQSSKLFPNYVQSISKFYPKYIQNVLTYIRYMHNSRTGPEAPGGSGRAAGAAMGSNLEVRNESECFVI